MTGYIYALPTTGSISFSDFAIDTTEGNAYTPRIADATQARANMRGVLKQSRRTDCEDRDYLRIVKVRFTTTLDHALAHDWPNRSSMTTSHTCAGSSRASSLTNYSSSTSLVSWSPFLPSARTGLCQVAMMVPLTPPPSILLANDALFYIIQDLPAAPTTVPAGRSRKHPSHLCHGPLKLLSLRHRLTRRVRIRARDKRQREERKGRETQLRSDAPL
jgi:hypothetical protein